MSKQAIITVVGMDRIGITATVTKVLAEYQLNILDIRQTILHSFFTMIMVVDLSAATLSLKELQTQLTALGDEQKLQISIQSEDIFRVMHRI